MSNFLIGMYGGFDRLKYSRDFRPGFFGVEACLFPGEKEVEELVRKAREDGFKFGVHYPLIRKETAYRDLFLIALDAGDRRAAWEQFESEAAYVSKIGGAYILTHFPKPVLVNRSLDLQHWRFAGEKEWMFADRYPQELLEKNLRSMFEGLNTISDKYGIQVVLEHDAMPTVLAEGGLLPDMLEKYDRVSVCLDIGRLNLQEKLDSSFDALKFCEMMAPYTYLVHLSNTNPIQNMKGGHYPVLPRLKPSEGWADVRTFIEIIKKYNSGVKILFEHRSDLVSDEELDECYRWVEELLVPVHGKRGENRYGTVGHNRRKRESDGEDNTARRKTERRRLPSCRPYMDCK